MTSRMLFLMDPIESINTKKDTTYVIMLAAQERGHELYYADGAKVYINEQQARVVCRPVEVFHGEHYYRRQDEVDLPLSVFSCVWVRKDPPWNSDYFFLTQLLEFAREDTVILNDPRGLREANEKLYALRFPDYVPPTLVTAEAEHIRGFVIEQGGRAIIKPLDRFGGEGVFLLQNDDPNIGSIIETATEFGRTAAMIQRFIPEVSEGDKRIFLVGGEPIGAVSRVASAGEVRSNFHSGGRPEKTELTEREREMCAALKPRLLADGLHLVGLDVIGDWLTEVNVTSPTCIQEINQLGNTRLEFDIVEYVEGLIDHSTTGG